MSCFRRPAFRPLITAPLLFAPGAALADITAAELWADWQSAAATQGMRMSAEAVTETATGLELTDLISILEDAELGDGRVVARVPKVIFRERGDGTVEVALPEGQRLEMSADGDGGDGDPERAIIDIDTSQLEIIASGTSSETDYSWSAPSLTAELTEFDAGAAGGDAAFRLEFADLAGQLSGYDGLVDAPVTARIEARETSLDLDINDPATGTEISTRAAQSQTVIQIESIGLDETGAPTEDGAIKIAYGSESGSQESLSNGRKTAELRHGKSDLRAELTETTVLYRAAAEAVSFVIDEPSLPLGQLAGMLETSTLAFAGPAGESEDPQPFDLTANLTGLALAETVWARLDPAGAIPREPLDLAVDLDGQVLLGDTARLPGLSNDGLPGLAPVSVAVNALALSFGETAASATGGFTFPTPAEMLTSGGAQQPAGSLVVTLNGIQELLAQLGQSGILPREQLLGAEMMLGIFAAPQPDGSLVSRIETTADGALYINGNQLR